MVTTAKNGFDQPYPIAKVESDSNGEHRREMEVALADPTFYPHRATNIQVEETHISKVFLTGDFAYKVKKPVNLGFLDFTTLKKRRHYCKQEVLLNQRLSKGVYLDVVAITREPTAYMLNGPGEPVEYAVKMRQLPREKTMLELLLRGKLSGAMVQELVDVLVRFYQKARKGPEIEVMGSREMVEINTREDFTQTEPFVPEILNQKKFSRLNQAVRTFLSNHEQLFNHRIETGFIRDCHGDLRLGHIYFLDHSDSLTGIQIIDCIEFNERFRYGDVAEDLAFLAMDLDYHGFAEVSQELITAYAQAANDPEVFLLLDFYKCYRAHVRCKVECLRQAVGDLPAKKARVVEERAQRYFDLASWYAASFNRPTLWIVCGLIGSGKSTIAAELAKPLTVKVLSSDFIRKKMFGFSPQEPALAAFEEGLYTPVVTARTYQNMLLQAKVEISNGNSVILDATFGKRQHRETFRHLAQEMGANVIFVECLCPDSELRKRLAGRQGKITISDARLQHLEAQRHVFEPLNELEDSIHVRVRTDQALLESRYQILSTTYLKLDQKKKASLLFASGSTDRDEHHMTEW
jgi:aminoglycoside phosphotransferase family enzyme/predicted kinase